MERSEEEQRAWEFQCYGMTSKLIRDAVGADAGRSIYDAGMVLAGHLSNLQEDFCNQESEDQTEEENRLRQELNVAKFILFEYIMDRARKADL